jgi:hypothetical protein
MKERPIMFSGAMVRSIIDGRKTQTRRVMRIQPTVVRHWANVETNGVRWTWPNGDEATYADRPDVIASYTERDFWKHCPYGQPGDRLWVRETWGKLDMGSACHRADDESATPADGRWRPSIHMPRWASRLTLEVTDVRVQRLREISEEDARAEGVDAPTPDMPSLTGRFRFECLWDSINGERPGCSWENNPWVWCVSFRRLP